jgi:apolipoprotein N-acyltransferase
MIPMLFYLMKSRERTINQSVSDFYIFGLILCGFANLFLFQMSPENWNIGLSGWITVLARLIAWCLVCLFSALAYALLGYCLGIIKNVQYKFYAFPFLFPIAELIRSYLYAAMSYGPKGSFSPNFNWGSLAVPGSGTVLVYSSRILGFFGISLLVILFNYTVWLLLRRKFFYAILLLCFIAFVTILGWKQGDSLYFTRNVTVSVVHLSEDDDMKSIDTNIAPVQSSEILVLPEYSGIEKDPQKESYLTPLSKNGVAITSIVNGKGPSGTNRIIYMSKTGDLIEQQDKTFLIPTGELLPYSLQASFSIIGKSSINVAFNSTQQIDRGKTPEKVYKTNNDIAIGTLACSGVSALNEYSRLTSEGASILVNSASLSFLTENSLYHVYAHNMARFQAVSNNRPLAQASRSGESYILDNQGRVLVESSGQNRQVLSASVRLPH